MAGPPLVTGATGFAGGHLLDHLLESEPAVAGWANPHGTPPRASGPRVTWAGVDLLDRGAVTDAIARLRPRAIYHCGGVADVGGSWADPARSLRVNALGTLHVLEAVRSARLDCAVLVTGSALVYRQSADPISETAPIGPANPYAFSKLAQEMLALRSEGIRVTVVRPFNHAGPGQSPAYVTSAFARQIAEIEAGRQAPVLHVGNLASRRDITDVRDTVRAYRLLVETNAGPGPYNVCCGRAYPVSDLLEMLVRLARVPVRIEVDSARVRPVDNPVVVGDGSKLARETGWTPRIPIERTLADLLDWWRARVA